MKEKHISYSPLIIKRMNPECRDGGEVKPHVGTFRESAISYLPEDSANRPWSHVGFTQMLSTRKNLGLLYHWITDPYLLESAIFSSNMWEKLQSYYGSPLFLRPACNPVCCGEFLLLTAALSGRCCLCNLYLLSHFSLPFSPRDLLCRAVDQSAMPLLCRP